MILSNPPTSSYYMETKKQACKALGAYPGGLQIGGGITAENAEDRVWSMGASHVIVTSYVFRGGQIRWGQNGKIEKHSGERESCHRCSLAREKMIITL